MNGRTSQAKETTRAHQGVAAGSAFAKCNALPAVLLSTSDPPFIVGLFGMALIVGIGIILAALFTDDDLEDRR